MPNLIPADFVRQDRFVEALYERQVQIDAERLVPRLLALVSRWSGDEDVAINAGSVLSANFTAETTLDSVKIETSELVAGEEPTVGLNAPGSDLSLHTAANSLQVRYNALLFSSQRIETMVDQILLALDQPDSAKALQFSLITESSPIPDPTADLDWSNFRGGIHDIFARNAEAHPDRTCVVETANPLDPSTKERSFTYKQIHEASNALANKLIKDGIEHDDVVVIYAYRGVDLVVAVMGTLKAGATFSVIDPAYPAERQNIYLSVAKPRALVYLRKAGVINPVVQEYIEQNCSIKSSVSGLELGDSLAYEGGVLSDLSSPSVVVGPDSHPTLSFTSGSEGIPKGVRGRHFSLAYYFPWMKDEFQLSSNDRFTMLSGIAHDPIQRDIFTPLFLGAQLMVPCADDIGTPGRLAEWMRESGATITHLTPAMGQLLSAQATAKMSSLRRAFFVGDILTKRDCTKLQALAENVDIINMYGTTETQRAVSFFRVPCISSDAAFLRTQKDTIPAGKGMLNVQLLVVNRNDRTKICGIGEVGEIYVRAGGLSDGYLDLPDMTAEKFLTSWFVPEGHWKDSFKGEWKGPRDRLYRSGDLGRYLPDGNVECSGRADDQVKIRGFRIELGEINTHISRHPAIRENIVLVKRHKDGEPVLVAYVVPESKDDDVFSAHESVAEEDDVVQGLVQYRRLIKNLKDYLKTKLPIYAVPSLVVPMAKLPLNPNGKIDKPRLPFPDAAQIETAAKHTKSDSTWTPTETAVRDLWIEVLGNQSMEPSDSFFDLGGHSILATRMIFSARTRFAQPTLPLGTIFEHPTIAEFAAAIDGSELVGAPSSESEAVEYAKDARELTAALPKYITRTDEFSTGTVFVTGVTGFLGSFLLRDLLQREGVDVIAHVRAKTPEQGLERIRTSGSAYGIWDESYAQRIKVCVAPLEEKHFGLADAEWAELCDSVDAVIHNGALVHWVYPYSTLRNPNVIATVNVLDLCAQGAPKAFTFVSSTSVIDTDHYVALSDQLLADGQAGIPESDDLEGSATGLGNGYGQSKWAAEYIIRQAGSRGLCGTIVRPGYILGDSQTGVCNTDDFLIRMLKGSQELGLYPNISNTVNMVPVDHVARVTVACALNPVSRDVCVAHVTSHPRITFSQFLGALGEYGYQASSSDYIQWRSSLEQYVVEKGDHALFPLLHFVLDNLPQSTKAPELDDANTVVALQADAKRTGQDLSKGAGVSVELLGVYFAFLAEVGYFEKTSKLPKVNVPKEVLDNFASAGGRSK